MFDKEPNWFAAICGGAYIASFLFLPVYTCVLLLPFKGLLLLSIAPVTVLLILLGLVMIASAILVERKISIGVGAACMLITLLFGMLGSSVLPLDVIGGVRVPVSMGWGMVLCVVLCVVYCVLELLIGNTRKKKIVPHMWDAQDGQGGQEFTSVDFF